MKFTTALAILLSSSLSFAAPPANKGADEFLKLFEANTGVKLH